LSEYTYDFTVAEAMTEEMSTITGQIGTWLADLDRDIVSTLQDWSSDARTAYDEAKAKWNEAAAKMPEALGRAQMSLAQISDGYRQAEISGVSAFQGG